MPLLCTLCAMLQHPFLPQSLYCVIGWPLEQSLSPLVHNYGFQTLGIPATYLKFPIPESKVENFVNAMRILPIAGASVTIPYKRTVIPYLDGCTPIARMIGAVNTLFWDKGRLLGDNTDITGFLEPLQSYNLSRLRVGILGAGGAARAALAALTMHKPKQIFIATPSNHRHIKLCEEFGASPVAWEDIYANEVDLLVNATPMGMHGHFANQTPFDFSKAEFEVKIAYDIVYNPVKTRFLEDAAAHGAQTISGIRMFFGQAKAQFALWTDKVLPHEAFEAIQSALNDK